MPTWWTPATGIMTAWSAWWLNFCTSGALREGAGATLHDAADGVLPPAAGGRDRARLCQPLQPLPSVQPRRYPVDGIRRTAERRDPASAPGLVGWTPLIRDVDG